MAIVALHSAASGLSALSQELDIIANNLANANTTGFKSSRANFEDLLYQQKVQPGVENADGDVTPTGLFVGLGTQIANTQFDFTQGSPVTTSGDLDVMIDGRGFFRVEMLSEEGGGIGYTRSGNFFRNAEGDLVLGNSNGPRLADGINIPGEATSVGIAADGTVTYYTPDSELPQSAGNIELANFVNPAGLKPVGGNLYIPTAASGPATDGEPGESNFGELLQGSLESSNVDPVSQLVQLIKTQRHFEMNSQTIKSADQTLQVVSNLKSS